MIKGIFKRSPNQSFAKRCVEIVRDLPTLCKEIKNLWKELGWRKFLVRLWKAEPGYKLIPKITVIIVLSIAQNALMFLFPPSIAILAPIPISTAIAILYARYVLQKMRDYKEEKWAYWDEGSALFLCSIPRLHSHLQKPPNSLYWTSKSDSAF